MSGNNVYEIDLSLAQSTFDVISQVCKELENPKAKNKNVLMKVGKIDLNQAQIQSIKSLISSYGSTLNELETVSEITKQSALELGIIVSKREIIGRYISSDDGVRSEYVILEDKNYIDNEKIVQGDSSEDKIGINVESNDSIAAKERLEQLLNESNVEYDIYKKLEEEKIDVNDLEIEQMPTKYVKSTLRSGQLLKFDGNILIIGDCNPGSEVIAKGDITVWGAMQGIAHAGSEGNRKAKVRAFSLEAIQLRIADIFTRKPDRGNIISGKNHVIIEEARIFENEIIILKDKKRGE